MSVLLKFQKEITAVAAATDGLGAAPDQLRMQIAVSRVVAVTESPGMNRSVGNSSDPIVIKRISLFPQSFSRLKVVIS